MMRRNLMVGVFFLLLIGLSAVGDWDPPGPPPLQVLVAVEEVRFSEVPDDGLNGEAELLLAMVAVSQAGRTQLVKSATLDLGSTHGVWTVNLADQLGFECSPASPVTIAYSITELDNGAQEMATALLLALGRAATSIWHPGLAAGRLAAGVVASMVLPVINGHDDLGSGEGMLDPGAGDQLITARGADGETRIHIRTVVNEVEDAGQCGPGEPEGVPTRGPERTPTVEEVRRAYEPLHENYWKIWWEMRPEGRFPGGQFYRVQTTYMRLYLAVAGAVALEYISAAHRAGADVREAWAQFEQGIQFSQRAAATRNEEQRDRNMDRALRAFERAAAAAASAYRKLTGGAGGRYLADLPRSGGQWAPVGTQLALPRRGGVAWAGQQTVDEFQLPLYLLLVPDYLAVKAGTTPGVPALVSRAEEEVEVTVSDTPAGMEAWAEPVEGAPGLFVIRLPTSGLAPGSYELTVTAAVDGENVSQKLTLWVEE